MKKVFLGRKFKLLEIHFPELRYIEIETFSAYFQPLWDAFWLKKKIGWIAKILQEKLSERDQSWLKFFPIRDDI